MKHGAAALLLASAALTPAWSEPVESVGALNSEIATAAPSSSPAGDIVVTAQRREQKLQDVPISASVVSGAALDRTATHTLEDVASRLPDIRIAQVPGSDSLNIRGVGSGNNAGFEQSVGTFVDGIYRGRSRASRVAFFDVDRIEVLRGPQTTFFGNNAIAGAISITTRKPGSQFEYNASSLWSPSDGEYAFEGGVTVPLTSNLSIRAAGRWSGMDGYIHNHLLDDKGPHLNDKLGRFSVRWEPTSTLTINARVDHGHLHDKGIYDSQLLDCPAAATFGTPKGACGRYLAASGGSVDDKLDYNSESPPSYLDLNYTEAALNAGLDLGGAKLTSLTGYYEHRYGFFATPLPVPGSSASVVGTASALPTRIWENYHDFSQEIRLESTGKRFLDYMIGGYFSRGSLNFRLGNGFYFSQFGALSGGVYKATDPLAVFTQSLQHDRTLSAFGAATVHFTHSLRLNLGLRYSSVRKSGFYSARLGISDDALNAATFVPGPQSAANTIIPLLGGSLGNYVNPHRTDSKLMPSASLQYDLVPNITAYASYNKGFKAGGYAALLSNAEFGPETVDAYEIGLKGSLFDRRLQFGLAGFISKYKGLQEATFAINAAGVPLGTIGNVARSTSQGVEANAALRVTRKLSMTFDAAYLDARYDKFPLGPCTAAQSLVANCVQDLSGKRRAYAPKISGNVGATYATPLNDKIEVHLDGSVFFTSRFFEQTSNDPLSIQPAYAMLDARIGVGPQDRRWEIAAIGKNLTDKTTSSFRSPLPSSLGSYQALVDRPLSVAIQLSIRG